MDNDRIDYMDGLRGIAILLVLLFHGFVRWHEMMPFGDIYTGNYLLKYGYLGVQLFFLISGFVIFMTLEKCPNIRIFLYKRWLRLFPAMLICQILVLISALFLTARPNGEIHVLDVIPGITFIDPYILFKLTGLEFKSLEAAFWSLYVEFKFYLIAAFIYFSMGRNKLVHVLSLAFLIDWLASFLVLTNTYTLANHLFSVTTILSFKYFGWFAAGSAFYLYYNEKNLSWYLYGCFIAVLACFRSGGDNIEPFTANLFILFAFAISLISPSMQKILRFKLILILGFISYPLYLIHENAMISITIQLSKLAGAEYSEVILVGSIALISSVAYVIANLIEPKTKTVIQNFVKNRC